VELFEPGDAQATEGVEAGASADRQVCVVELRHREIPQGWQPLSGRVRTTILSPRALVRYGDEILVEGLWSRVPAPGNPGQYDWQATLARKRIHGLLRVRPYDGLVVLRSGHHRGARGRNPPVPALRADPDGRRYGVPNARAFGRRGQGNPVLAAIFRLRERWVRLIQKHFEPRDAGLLLALLLGERAEIDEDLKKAFQTTGTIHLLVISGFNVGIIAVGLELLLRLAGLSWRLRPALAALGVAGYCLLTGAQPLTWLEGALGEADRDRGLHQP